MIKNSMSLKAKINNIAKKEKVLLQLIYSIISIKEIYFNF